MKNYFVRKTQRILLAISIFILILYSLSPLIIGNNFDKAKAESILSTNDLSLTPGNYVEGEVLVKYKQPKIDLAQNRGLDQVNSFEKTNKLSTKDEFKNLNIKVLKSVKSTKEMIDNIKNDPNVEYVEPNYIRTMQSTTPNDTSFSEQWGLNNTGQLVNGTSGTNDADIDAPEAFSLESASQTDVIIAVIDTGVLYNHPDLHDNMWDGSSDCKDENNVRISGGCSNHGWDLKNSDDNPVDDFDHGTHVAGIIAGISNNSTGISGASYQNNLKIMALKVTGTDGLAPVDTIIKAINFAKNNGASVVNASFGKSEFSQAEKDAIEAFGGIFVAAAGNNSTNNENTHYYPSDYDLDNIISIAATDQNDALASFSNYGAASVDVGAPGVNILSPTFLKEEFSDVTPPSFAGSIFTKTSGNWRTTADGDAQADSTYTNNSNGIIILTTPIDTSTYGTDTVVSFYLLVDIENSTDCANDYLALETDNNDENWVTKEKFCGFHYGDLESVSLGTGSSNMRIRFVWHTNSSVTSYLLFPWTPEIDDIQITNSHGYQYMQGTSMAAPYVTGLAGLIKSYNTNLASSQIKNYILNYGDAKASLSGKTVSGKRINLYGSISAVVQDAIPPIVNAGIDKITNAEFAQDATVSGSDSYLWSKTSGPGTINFGSATSEDTTISASIDGTYVIRLTATNNVGSTTYDEMTLVWDATAPTNNSILITSAYSTIATNSTDSTLTLSSTDATSGLYQMRFANDNTGSTWSLWETFSPSKSNWTLIYGDGTKTVYAQFKDNAGNISTPVNDTIIFDDTPPYVNAGIDKTTNTQFTQDATVDAAVSGVRTYSWRKEMGPGTITFGSATSEDTTISASVDGTYVIRLMVSDNANNLDMDYMTLVWDTAAPTVSAGSDQAKNTSFTQIGTVSDSTSGVASYAWSKISGPGVITFGSDSSASTTISASVDGTYVIRLTATDNAGNSAYDEMTLVWDITPPTVNAGADQTKNTSFTQTGTASDTTSGIVTYIWSKVSGPGTITFGSATSEDTTIAASVDGTYVIRLTSTDLAGNSAYDEMTLAWGINFNFQTWFNSGVHNWGVDNSKKVVSGDFNGDGKQDMAVMYDYGNENMSLFVFPGNGSNAFGTYQSWYNSGHHNWAVDRSKQVVAGDFNHDGKDDIAIMYDYGNENMSLIVFTSNGAGFNPFQNWFISGTQNWSVDNSKKVVAGDFNHDSKDDIAVMYDYGNENMSLFVFTSTGSTFNTYQSWYNSGPHNWGVDNSKQVVGGDFNGDGSDDIAIMYDYGNENMSLIVFTSNGSNAFNTFQNWFTSGAHNWGVDNSKKVVSGDFNGDGHKDIAVMYDYGNENMSLFVFRGTGSSFNIFQSWYNSGPHNWGVDRSKQVVSGDFNNDGYDEIGIMYDYGNENMSLIMFSLVQ